MLSTSSNLHINSVYHFHPLYVWKIVIFLCNRWNICWLSNADAVNFSPFPFRFDSIDAYLICNVFFSSLSQQLPVFNFISESEICIDPFSVRCFCCYHKIKLFRCNHQFVCEIRIVDADNHVECTKYNRYSWSYTVTVVAVFFDLLWII